MQNRFHRLHRSIDDPCQRRVIAGKGKSDCSRLFSFRTIQTLLTFLLILYIPSISSFSLPFIFKLGVEKGRIAYYAMVGFICAASAASALVFKGQQQAALQQNVLLAVSPLAAIGIYLLSWHLSIVFYKKREIT